MALRVDNEEYAGRADSSTTQTGDSSSSVGPVDWFKYAWASWTGNSKGAESNAKHKSSKDHHHHVNIGMRQSYVVVPSKNVQDIVQVKGSILSESQS